MMANPLRSCSYSRLSQFAALLFIASLCGCAALQQAAIPEPASAPEPEPQPEEVVISDELRAAQELQQQLLSMDQRLQSMQQQIGDLQKSIPPATVALAPPLRKSPVPSRPLPPQTSAKQTNGKTLVGKVEWLWVQNFQQSIPSLMNSGGHLSFMHVRDLKLYERDGERWVSFTLDYQPAKQAEDAPPLTLDVKVERTSRSRAQPEDKREPRPVIQLPVRLGNLQQVANFVLTEKSFGKEPFALGRDFMKDLLVVDVSEEFLQPKYVPPPPATITSPAPTATDNSPESDQ